MPAVVIKIFIRPLTTMAIMPTSIITMVIHIQVRGVFARLAAAFTSRELKNSGVKMMSGNESKTKQQINTNAGSMMRHKPLSRKFSVFAVPYACLCSAGFSDATFWLEVMSSTVVLLK